MDPRKTTNEHQPSSIVEESIDSHRNDDDYDPESQTIRIPLCRDEDDVTELNFHDDPVPVGFANWDS